MTSPTFEVCIDEAGDDGMNCSSGDWLILSAVVGLRIHYKKDIDLIRNVKRELQLKEKKPLHFRDLKESQKRILVTRISEVSKRIRVITVLAHKPSFDPKIEPFHEKRKLYFFLVRFLLERVSWACRDSKSIRKAHCGDGTARITLSLRNDLPYQELRDYFVRLQDLTTTIEWGIIKPHQIRAMRNASQPGLQIADAAASAMYCCDHHCHPKRTSEWAALLKPAIYSHNKKYKGYGIKVFPPLAETKMAQGIIGPWAINLFNY